MSVSLNTRITELLGCQYPIIQTAMGWVADPRLVAGTCNAGGFGFLAGATIPPEQMEAAILKTKELTNKPFGVNFHMYQPNAPQIVDMVVKHGVRAVSYSRSPGKDMVKKLKDAGVICMPTIGLPKHAAKAIEMGADAVTIQGGEGGGHTGAVPTTLLVPQVIDAVAGKVPVLAAGGFKDGRGLVAAMAWGADGIAMGTRFLMTTDVPTPASTLAKYLEVDEVTRIRVTTAVDGMRHRMIDNPFIRRLESASPVGRLMIALRSAWQWKAQTGMSLGHMIEVFAKAIKEDPSTVSQVVMSANQPVLLQHSMVQGRPDEGILPSGQVAAAIGELKSCREVIESIAAEAETCLRALYERAEGGKESTS